MKKRTRAQKIKAQAHRQLQNERGEYSFQAPAGQKSAVVTRSLPVTPKTLTAKDLFPYDVRFIYWDLAKTVGLTAIIIVCLVIIARVI